MQRDLIRANELSPEDAQAILAFLNSATVGQIATAVELPSRPGQGRRAAASLMSRRRSLQDFTDIRQVAFIGPYRFTALVNSVRELHAPTAARVSPVGITTEASRGSSVAPAASDAVIEPVESVRREDAPPAGGERAATEQEDSSMAATRSRSYTAGRFALTTGGSVLGFLSKYTGGSIKAEVATHLLGPTYVAKKHIARLIHEDLTIDVDMNMSRQFYEWIGESFENRDAAKDVEVHCLRPELYFNGCSRVFQRPDQRGDDTHVRRIKQRAWLPIG